MSLSGWRVAVVGAGPAAMYLVEQLLEQDQVDVEIDVFEQLPTPWGLVRNGVAPDHPEKKLVIDRLFSYLLADRRVRFFGAVDVGRDISHGELASWYGAVIYAIGADGELRLRIPGEDLPGSIAARDFIGWCAGHPGHNHMAFDLSGERAVVVGNGNVALDIARMLTLPVAELERTEMSDRALEALSASQIREVVVLGRRDRSSSAFNNPELEELEHLRDVNVSVEGDEDQSPPVAPDRVVRRKLATFERLTRRPETPGAKRIVLRFLASPVAVQGADKVEGVQIMRNRLDRDENDVVVARPTGEVASLACSLVIRAVGYRGVPQPGLPFDEARGVIANTGGRLEVEDGVAPGRYVAGWAKRGCRGIIGSNKKCAKETVHAVLADIQRGELKNVGLSRSEVADRVRSRCSRVVSYDGWSAINRAELKAGRVQQRPRVKITDTTRLLEVAGGG